MEGGGGRGLHICKQFEMHERFLLSPSTVESCLHPGLIAPNLPRGHRKKTKICQFLFVSSYFAGLLATFLRSLLFVGLKAISE